MKSERRTSKILTQDLLESKNYREFIVKALGLKADTRNWGAYSTFSRKAGFSSRSYVREVVTGKKRISIKTLPKFSKALGLLGEAKNYFSLLVMLEEPDVNSERRSSKEIRTRMEKIQARLLGRYETAPVSSQEFLNCRNWFEIQAALGRAETGATLAEISQRTKLSLGACQEILAKMRLQGCVRYEEAQDRFFPKATHLIFNDLGASISFQDYYLRFLGEVSKHARRGFEANDQLYLTSVFSIDRHRASQFKQELRELLVRFVDESEVANGNAVGRLLVAFHPN